MVLPRTPIVLCELAEDMEYEVKRIFEGSPWAQPRVEKFYYSTLSYQKQLNTLTSCLRYKFFPLGLLAKVKTYVEINARSMISFRKLSEIIAFGGELLELMLTFSNDGRGFISMLINDQMSFYPYN